MNKVWSVAMNEFLNSVRSKAFVVGLLAMPVMLGVVFLVQSNASKGRDLSSKSFAVVDETGVLFEGVEAAANERNQSAAAKDQADFLPEVSREDEVSLAGQVRSGELFAFVVIKPGVLSGGEGVKYYSDSPTDQRLPRWLGEVLQKEIQEHRMKEAGIEPKEVTGLLTRVPLERLGLPEVSESGEMKEAVRDNEIVTTVIPFATVLVMFMMLMTSVPHLLTSVMEEKMNKVSEFLISAVTPFQLLLGKLIGAVGVSLVLASAYLVALSYIAHRYEVLQFVPGMVYLWLPLFLILGGVMLGSVCMAIGAACNEVRDSQSLMFPVMMIASFPLMVATPILESPNSSFAQIVSLIPPFTPSLMLLRMTLPGGVAWWELLLGVVLTTAFAMLCVKGAAKIFRIGILSQGQTPSIARMLRWLREKG